MAQRITKHARAERLARARELLEATGWRIHQPVTVADNESVIAALVAEFGCQRRTARLYVAQAARLLRGEVVSAWQAGAGRPRKWVRVQVEDARRAGLIET